MKEANKNSFRYGRNTAGHDHQETWQSKSYDRHTPLYSRLREHGLFGVRPYTVSPVTLMVHTQRYLAIRQIYKERANKSLIISTP
jgi:hypothetical protein